MTTQTTYFIKLFLLGFCLMMLKPLWADSAKDSLLTNLHESTNDSLRIKTLFELGNLYINGPSDSLIHYYEKGLKLTRSNLKRLAKEETTSGLEYDVYKNLEIRAIIEFGIEYFFRSDYEKALEYDFEALEIARGIGDAGLLSEVLSEIGIVYKNQGKFEQALQYYSNAVDFAEQTSDTSWIASLKVNMGNVYKEQGYLTLALKYYLEALSDLERMQHDRRIAACFQNIGDVYNKQHDYNKALEYYCRALQLAKSTGDIVRETSSYMNIGYVYACMNAYTRAREFYDLAMALFEQSGYSHEKDDAYILIGDTYRAEGDLKTAKQFYRQALNLSEAEGDLAREAEVLIKLGEIHKLEQQYEAAAESTRQGLELAQRVGELTLQIDAFKNLSEISEKLGRHSESIELFQQYAALKDTLFSAEKYRAVREMEMKYETEKKEAQLALLEEQNEVQNLRLSRRNRMMYTIIGVAGLLLIIGYITFRNFRLRSRQRAITLEQQLMRSQMNPHFTFNSLIAIQSYIYKQDPVKAGDFLAKFADLVRITLENSRVEFVLLEKELRMLRAYLELQSLRYDGKFDFLIDLDENIDPAKTLIPPMMAQPFIENAIEHGLRHKSEQGNLTIIIQKEKFLLRIIVEDNGVGREKAHELEINRKHQSMATGITRERLANLGKKFRQKFILQIEDLKAESGEVIGTRVILEVPYKESNR